MNRFRTFWIVELVVLVLLAGRLLTHRAGLFVPAIVIAIVFSALAGSTKQRLFGFVACLAWLFVLIAVLTTGWFWLLLIWPIIYFGFVYRRQAGQQPPVRPSGSSFGNLTAGAEAAKDVTADGSDRTVEENDLVDLDDLSYHEGFAELNIRKNRGNTKLIVPLDTAVRLTATTLDGTVKAFDEQLASDVTSLHYEMPGFDAALRKVEVRVYTISGDIEVVSG